MEVEGSATPHHDAPPGIPGPAGLPLPRGRHSQCSLVGNGDTIRTQFNTCISFDGQTQSSCLVMGLTPLVYHPSVLELAFQYHPTLEWSISITPYVSDISFTISRNRRCCRFPLSIAPEFGARHGSCIVSQRVSFKSLIPHLVILVNLRYQVDPRHMLHISKPECCG